MKDETDWEWSGAHADCTQEWDGRVCPHCTRYQLEICQPLGEDDEEDPDEPTFAFIKLSKVKDPETRRIIEECWQSEDRPNY